MIIAFANQKGGVGKTTTTFNVAANMTQRGKKVLTIDMDSTPSLTRVLGYSPEEFDITIYDLFKDRKSNIGNAIYSVDLIPGLSFVAGTEFMAAMEIEINSYTAREYRLKKILEPAINIFDYILIDCPPQLSTLTINALTTSDYVVIPCETSRLGYYVLDQLSETIKTVQEDLNNNLKVLGTIATKYTMRAKDDNEILKALEEHDQWECIGVCRNTVKAKKGVELGLPVVMTMPNSQLAQSYVDITTKIMEMTKGE